MKHLYLYEKYSHYEEAKSLDKFVGYHCSKSLIYDFDGTIKDHDTSIFNTYGKDWFIRLLENLGWHEQVRTKPEGLSEDDPKLNRWYDMVNRMLTRRNIHWIFVSRDRPYTRYGEYHYAVSMDADKALFVMDDDNEIDSDIYVYNHERVKPTLVPLFDMPEPKKVAKLGAFTPDKNAEGLGLFQRSERYRFPWELTEREYNNDVDDAKYGEPYPHRASVESERFIYQLLGVKPFSISQHETLCRFKEYMDTVG